MSRSKDSKRIEELSVLLRQADYDYYVAASPTMSDSEYDALLSELRNSHSALLDDITNNDRKVDGDLADQIKGVIENVKKSFAA